MYDVQNENVKLSIPIKITEENGRCVQCEWNYETSQ